VTFRRRTIRWTAIRSALLVVAFVGFGVIPEASAQVRTDVYVSGLTRPLGFVQDPSDATVQYVVEQGGLIRAVVGGQLQEQPFLDLSESVSSGGEAGLMGLAFPPDYGATGRFYVNFTVPEGGTVIARFRRSADSPTLADPGSRFDLLWSTGERLIREPTTSHHGGNLAFGPDG
jgi:glucose/arabinose dehydrogenase